MKSILSRLSSFSILLLALGAGPCSAQTPVTIPITGDLGQIAGTPQPNAYITLLLENCSGGLPQITGYTNIVPTSAQFVADTNGQINGTVWANDQITCGGTTGATIYALSLYDPNNNQIGQTQCFQVVHTQGVWNINTQSTVACGTTPPNPTNGTFGNLNSTGFFQGNNGAFTGSLTVDGTVIGHSTLDLPLAGGALTGPVTGPVINNSYYPTSFATVQSDVTACASATCTIVLNSSITTTADLTIPNNVVVQFNNGAVLNYGVHALTIGPIQAAPVQIFSGTGTLTISPLVKTAPVQWWGAVADSNHLGTTGTDNTVAIQACLSSVAQGAECFVSAGDYKVTSALLINRSGVSLRGASSPVTSPAWATPHPSRIVTSSATADIIDIWGPSSSVAIADNYVHDITLTRGVIPSAGGLPAANNAGISEKFTYESVVENVSIEDSANGIYFHGVGASAKGHFSNIDVVWGVNGLVETTGTLVGYYVDTMDGTFSPSLRLRDLDAQAPGVPTSHPGLEIVGISEEGKQDSDLHVYHFEGFLIDYGIVINGLGMSGFAQATDIFLENCILDSTLVTGVLVEGTHGFGTININDGWIFMDGASVHPAIDMEVSSNVLVSNEKIYSPSLAAPVIYSFEGGSSQIIGNEIIGGPAGAIAVDSSLAMVISNNIIAGQNNYGTDIISLTNGSSYASVTGNTINGTATNGITIDGTTTGVQGLETNSIGDPALGTITNKFNVSDGNFLGVATGMRIGTNPTTITGAQGNDVNLLTSGTVSATVGLNLCTDALGGATTTGCSGGGGSGNATSIQSVPVDPTAPTSGQLLAYNGTSWIPTTTGGSVSFASVTAGTSGAHLVMGAGGSLTVTAGGTVQATSLSGNIPESQVTNLTTDLGGKVATTTTVNGHALSANVVVSASDLTTGTLPHAALPTLLSGDIPANAANTTGTSGGLTGNPSIGVTNITIAGACTGCPGAGSLPNATDTLDKLVVNNVGTASLLTPANDAYNVVVNGGIDNTCVTDVSSAIASIITTESALTYPPALYFPAGCYKVNSGILLSCTSTTCSGISIYGAGSDSTIFQSDCSGHSYVLWYNNTTNSGDNFKGMAIANLQLQDTSGTGACADGLRLTQTSLNSIRNVKRVGFQGKTYSTGTIAISGSTVTGTGTTFTAAMVPGVVQVAGVMAEACGFTSATVLTLCDTAWPTGTVGAGASYAIAYNGRSLTFDAGFSFTQYISVWDSFGYGNLFDVYSMGTTNGGNSRISIQGHAGWSAPTGGSRIANSVGYWLGKHSDTFTIDTPTNFHTRCWVLDSAHVNKIGGVCEDNSTYAVVTTCNGGVAAQSCNFGAEISADTPTSSGYGNAFTSPNIYLTGTAFKVDNAGGAYNLDISALRAASFSNTNNYNFSGTLGCPLQSSGVQATIRDFDCVYSPIAPVPAAYTITTNTTSVAAGTCTAQTGVTVTGVATTSTLTQPNPTTTVSGVSGWGSGGSLRIQLEPPTANTVNFDVCNDDPGAAHTPGGTVSWRGSWF